MIETRLKNIVQRVSEINVIATVWLMRGARGKELVRYMARGSPQKLG